jgi:GNAT superfamily N-acetyltransferase
MHTCSIHRELEIVPGDMSDYKSLAVYHYRANRPAAVKAVYVLRPKRPGRLLGHRPAGVIVYTMPNPRVALRASATGGVFRGLDHQKELELLNRHVRCIARVVIEPRLRGIGLAVRLVRETMPLLDVPLIEALAVMPRVNPFLERAGLKCFEPQTRPEQVELLAALAAAGIGERLLIDPASLQQRLDQLAPAVGAVVETRIRRFLKSHGRRRTMPAGLERTRYLLSVLMHRPAYYIWRNPRAGHLPDRLGPERS